MLTEIIEHRIIQSSGHLIGDNGSNPWIVREWGQKEGGGASTKLQKVCNCVCLQNSEVAGGRWRYLSPELVVGFGIEGYM